MISFRSKPVAHRRSARNASALLVCLALAACLAPPTVMPADPQSAPPTRLRGILDGTTAPPSESVRVFLVHGMGTGENEVCALAPVIAHLAAALKVRQDTAGRPPTCDGLVVPEPRSIAVRGTNLEAELYTYTFSAAADGPKVQFSFLLWAPLTKPIEAARLAEPNHPSWAVLTSVAKSFIQTHLGDVVLYGGAGYRPAMREAVERALCIFVGGTPQVDARDCVGGDREQTVLITHSLGGYMLADAIDDIAKAHPTHGAVAEETDAAAKALARSELFFMLANQLALLDLTTLTQYPASSAATEPQGALGGLEEHWRARHQHPGRQRQLVAVSDPNDILSYLVSFGDVPVGDDPLLVANVYLGVARNWFNLLAWPPDAHDNYLTNTDVMDIIACGMDGDAILPCSP